MTTNQILVRLLGLTALLLTVPAGLAGATTIVVARTANKIVIGADSKVTDAYGKELNSQLCKIQPVGNLFIAFEGLLRDKATGFNVPAIQKKEERAGVKPLRRRVNAPARRRRR